MIIRSDQHLFLFLFYEKSLLCLLFFPKCAFFRIPRHLDEIPRRTDKISRHLFYISSCSFFYNPVYLPIIKLLEMKNLLFFFCLIICVGTSAKKKIKVACVGNSVTYGYGLSNRERDAYPVQLQNMLGNGYEVRNFGKSGSTLLYNAYRPYVKQTEFADALGFSADIIVIHLGLNDTDPRAWPDYGDEFIHDYRALIDSFRKTSPKSKIFVCRMTPIDTRHSRFISGTRDWYGEIQNAIELVAKGAKVELIDLNAPLYNKQYLFPDALHPNAEGARIIAKTVSSAITGNYGGLSLPQIYSDSMVLQRNVPLTISGMADAGEIVGVSIAGEKAEAKTSVDGRWKLALKPLKAGGPYTLTVATKKRTLAFKDVLVGEVWLCSGQSNMAFMVKQSATAKQDIASASKHKKLRLFDMKGKWDTNAEQWDSIVLDSVNSLQYYKSTMWEGCSEKSVADFSAIAFSFGAALSDSLNVPVGLICNAVGGSTVESWINRRTLEYNYPAIFTSWFDNDHIQPWVRERAAFNVKKSKSPLQRHPYQPAYLFASGIMPLEHFNIAGAIWYQGESNAHNMELHERLFPLLVESWRTFFDSDSLPFYFVQLSSLSRPSWPRFRDSQRKIATEMDGVEMVVSSDLGDSLDVHPRFKREIGERLARLSLAKKYGFDNLTPCGPEIKKATMGDKNKVILLFENAKGLRPSSGEKLLTFEIADEGGIFHKAEAEVKGNTIELLCPERIMNPTAVRYGWQPFTRANLVNDSGLPASTFVIKISR